jgi:release factor glutamine methyltransferase
MASVGELLNGAVDRLRDSGSETARLDAELLLGHAIGADRSVVIAHPEAPVGADAARHFEQALARRVAGEPVAYIRGLKEFYGLAFSVDIRALIPRPETERLVELAEQEVLNRLTRAPRPAGALPLRIADVGTGSGAVAVALAVALRRRGMLGEVDILATDASSDAVDLARENAVAHGVADRVRLATADLLPPVVDPPFEVVLANLPYVRTDAIAGLPVAASFEPRAALDGGRDGLEVIAGLLERLPAVLAPGGVALVEIGGDQRPAMEALAAVILPRWGCTVELDLGALPRVARLSRP